MPKSIRARSSNNDNSVPTSNPAGHDTTFANQLKQLVSASVVYTKDVILAAIKEDYVPETSNENLDLLGSVLSLPPPSDAASKVDNEPPVILNNEINYVSENIQSEFLTLRANEEVNWYLTGADAEKFQIEDNALKLKDGVSADFETNQSFNITLTTTDESGNQFSKDFQPPPRTN